MGATTPAPLCLSFALSTRLRTFIVSAAAELGQDTSILYLAVETFECNLKRISRIHVNVTHEDYQRERWSLLRPEPCD